MKKSKTLDEVQIGDEIGLAHGMEYPLQYTVTSINNQTITLTSNADGVVNFIKSNKIHQQYFIEFQDLYEIASSPLAKALREED